ncbi:hypothetical protein [Streptomyces sp. NPDC050564]
MKRTTSPQVTRVGDSVVPYFSPDTSALVGGGALETPRCRRTL